MECGGGHLFKSRARSWESVSSKGSPESLKDLVHHPSTHIHRGSSAAKRSARELVGTLGSGVAHIVALRKPIKIQTWSAAEERTHGGASREKTGMYDGDREGTYRGREEELQRALDRERSKGLLVEYEVSELRKAVHEERSRHPSAEEQAAAWKTALELSEQRLHAEMENAAFRLDAERMK